MIIQPAFLTPGQWVPPRARRSKHRNAKRTKGRKRMEARLCHTQFKGYTIPVS